MVVKGKKKLVLLKYDFDHPNLKKYLKYLDLKEIILLPNVNIKFQIVYDIHL